MDDIDRLRRETSISDFAFQEGVAIQKNGSEWEGCCPFHQEDTPSFTIFKGNDGVERFHCFGCGERGDIIDFVEKVKGISKRDAFKYLGGGQSSPNISPKATVGRDIYEGITPIFDPDDRIYDGKQVRLYNPKRADDEQRRWGSFVPSAVYPYRKQDGTLIGYVLRHEIPTGKETPMVCRVRLRDGTECWSRFPFPKPRPLYREDRLEPGQVIVVEGEKCADRAAAALGRQTVTWAGGTFGIKHTDWSPLAGRSVVIWPDADLPGIATSREIASILHGLGCTVRLIRIGSQA